MSNIKKYKGPIIAFFALVLMYVISPSSGMKAANLTLYNFKSMGLILPPIFILIGLLDVWVPKETMVKYMGSRSGIVGVLIALTLGAVGAGPLYVAFPVAAVLIKKGARLAYVFMFLSAWVSVKLPIFMFEWVSFGTEFTFIHVISSLTVYISGSLILEKLMTFEMKEDVMNRAEKLSA